MGKKYTDAMWKEAKKKARLNTQTIQMAKELGLNPKSIIKNIPSKNQEWKAPVHEWIRGMYEERFGRVKKAKKNTHFSKSECANNNKKTKANKNETVSLNYYDDIPF